MTEQVYLNDSYKRNVEAVVTNVDGRFAVLDKTVFYAESGGQPFDTGFITYKGREYNVVSVKKGSEGISHELDKGGLKAGDKVLCSVDWERRYKLMRYHTATHVLSAVIHNETSSLITGNQLSVDKARIDFNLEDFSRERMEMFIQRANDVVKRGAAVKACFISREEALQDPTLIKLAKKEFLERLGEIRIVEIAGVDRQLDGGTHVKSLAEIGTLSLLKTENKGKSNRRVYFKID